MKKHVSHLALCVAALLLGCASREVTRIDTGPVVASTFSFIPRGTRPLPASADDREEVHAAIQEAITTTLAGKGLRRVADGGDLVVAYLVIVGDKATTQAIDDYFGYGRSYATLHAEAHAAYTSAKRPDLVNAGTLLIDLIDPRTRTVVTRNHVTRPILRDPSPETRAANVQGAVDEALAGLRVAR